MIARVVLALCLVLILGVPLVMRPRAEDRPDPGVSTLVIITPHVQQIRYEFDRAFSRWHQREYGEPVRIDWRTPGGTREIQKLLSAEVIAAARRDERQNNLVIVQDAHGRQSVRLQPSAVGFDIMFGGGSYEHEQLKVGVTLPLRVGGPATDLRVPTSRPAQIDRALLDEILGENRIGSQTLFDPDLYWIGTALSGFGIVYNRDVLRRLGVDDPTSFEDLTDPRLAGWVALSDPRQSGSITTTFDSILGFHGWEAGWRILREMSANARYFTNASTKPPIDISQGEAAAGLAIDFYGRSQAAAVRRPGEDLQSSRVGYVDPKGATYVDADPVSILNGAPNGDLAERFVRFCLTREAQALWQFRARGEGDESAESADMGPIRYELRRMPIRRDMYADMSRFTDPDNPFEVASDIRNPGWRTGVEVMMAAFGIETAREQRQAWQALNAARRDPAFPSESLARMEELYYAFPLTRIVNPLNHSLAAEISSESRRAIEAAGITTFAALRRVLDRDRLQITPEVRRDLVALAEAEPEFLPFTAATHRAVRDIWRDPVVMDDLRIEYREFFARNYRETVAIFERR